MNRKSFDPKRIVLAMIAVMAAVFALGCKHTSTPIDATPSVTPGVSEKATPTVAPTATPIPTPTPIVDMPLDRVSAEELNRTADEEGELVIPGPEVWEVLNPFYSTEPKEVEIVDQTQVRLFDIDENGEIRAGIDYPCIAYSVVKTEEGIKHEGEYQPKKTDAEQAGEGEEGEAGETEETDETEAEPAKEKTYDKYTIVLKEGLTFADGTPVTVDDVIFSLYTLSDIGYEGANGLGGLDIYGMRAYNTQVPESVRAEAALAIEGGLTEAGTCPKEFTDKTLWTAVWINFDKAGVAFVEDMIKSVMENPKLMFDAPVQAFLSPYLTFAHVQASPSLQVLYTMTMFGYVRSFNYSKNTMRDCFDVVHDLNEEELTPELFWGLIKEYYGYNLSDTGINYERGYKEKRYEDYLAEAYYAERLGVESIEGITVSEAAFGDDALRPCIEVTIASDADLADFNFYVVEKSVYENDLKRTDVLTGAGKYILVSNDENGALLEANENYMLGVEKQKYLRYIVEEENPEEEGTPTE